MTTPEVRLWNVLRQSRMEGLRFRRQHPIGRHILDFYCPSARLAIEVDGADHARYAQIRRDRARDAWLSARNIRVIRVQAGDALNDDALDGFITMLIDVTRAPSTAFGGPPPPLRRGG
jgi:very-short-patch-repair endonuclease